MPDGAEHDFWLRLQRAHAALRSRIVEADVDKVWRHLEEARDVRQSSRVVVDENRVFDPGVT